MNRAKAQRVPPLVGRAYPGAGAWNPGAVLRTLSQLCAADAGLPDAGRSGYAPPSHPIEPGALVVEVGSCGCCLFGAASRNEFVP